MIKESLCSELACGPALALFIDFITNDRSEISVEATHYQVYQLPVYEGDPFDAA